MEPITIWREDGGRLIERPDDGTGGMLPGGAWTKLRALPRADFDALAAEAADARTLRAERDSLVKERDGLLADNIRLDQALCHAVASGKPDAVPSWQYELMRESNRRHRELRDAATARADAASERLARAEALLREARFALWALANQTAAPLVARIDAHLEGK